MKTIPRILALAALLALSSCACSYRVLWWHSDEPEELNHYMNCGDAKRISAMAWCRGCCGVNDPQCDLADRMAALCKRKGFPDDATP